MNSHGLVYMRFVGAPMYIFTAGEEVSSIDMVDDSEVYGEA